MLCGSQGSPVCLPWLTSSLTLASTTTRWAVQTTTATVIGGAFGIKQDGQHLMPPCACSGQTTCGYG
eukprot:CAMPEP_0169469098 /NCGR_PEP_ID=MMETSP1042-20121227/23288_1 /TAXON_ID=464988 /ORGANISM="Hemiselmis andersenii, Strain CCMP1180" /LENGTH=66 /DNA_ID=CAMNT_0009582531 /DNA_START=255 /DNA_END=452 /DNA_ORIENTATION=+